MEGGCFLVVLKRGRGKSTVPPVIRQRAVPPNTRLRAMRSLLRILVIGSIVARGTQRLNCSMRGSIQSHIGAPVVLRRQLVKRVVF